MARKTYNQCLWTASFDMKMLREKPVAETKVLMSDGHVLQHTFHKALLGTMQRCRTTTAEHIQATGDPNHAWAKWKHKEFLTFPEKFLRLVKQFFRRAPPWTKRFFCRAGSNRWSGAGVGVGMLRGAGYFQTSTFEEIRSPNLKLNISNFQMCKLPTFKLHFVKCHMLFLLFAICHLSHLRLFKFQKFKFPNFKQITFQN